MRASPVASPLPDHPPGWPLFMILAMLGAATPLVAQAPRAVARPQADPVAITHVTVIEVATGARLADRTVLVRDGRVAAVDTAPRVRVPRGLRVLDGQGRFLIPGLWDMHVHLVADGVTRTSMFPLFVANGVTGVRDMWGDCDSPCAANDGEVRWPVAAAVVEGWKRDIASGALIGPRIVASSAIFDGPSPMFPGSYAIRSAEEARDRVRLARQHGADFIKVLPGVSPESYRTIVEEAGRNGLSLAGHVPWAMTPLEVSDLGQRSIEHLDDLVGLGPYRTLSCSSQPDAVRAALFAVQATRDTSQAERARLRTVYRRLVVGSYSEERCAGVFAHLARNGTWRVPTLVVYRNGALGRLGDTLVVSDPRLRYVDRGIREVWRQMVAGALPRTAEDSASIRDVAHLVVSLPAAMMRSGVPLLAGSDEPNPWVIPGFALHDELALLVQGGLTPLEALQAATVNPARFLEATDSLGAIAPGKLADLVLLDADPLADIHNTSRIAVVIVNGRVFTRPELDQLLAGAGRAAERMAH